MNKEGLEIIKKYEGCMLSGYICPAGVPTIGYGTTRYPNGKKVSEFDIITKEQAENYLLAHCKEVEKQILPLLETQVTQNQLSAMVSLVYNIGIGNFKTSSVLRFFNEGDIKKAADSFLLWNKGGRPLKTLPGLIKRRQDEMNLFLKDENTQ